jgi:hypothetical protein
MTPQINLETSTIARMKEHAVPLEDTHDSVVNRALDALDALTAPKPDASGIRAYNPASPPPLAFTTVKSVKFKGIMLAASDAWWNPFMFMLIREARKTKSVDEVSSLLFINHAKGEKANNGYKFLKDAGLSVQGQDANNAWKQCYELLKALQLPAEVKFTWQDNPKAAHPNESGKFIIDWK